MKKKSFFVIWQLLKKELLIFFREYRSKFIDTCFLFFTNVLVFSYFMPYEGVSENFGPFLLIGAIASFGLIELVGKVSTLVSDIEGVRSISSTLIMPIRSEYIFATIAVFWAISSALMSAPLFPIGKLLLFTRFDLTKISYFRLVFIFFTVNLFFGFFALWLSGLVKGIDNINMLWLRIIVPMWMFGTYFYSWQSAYKLSPVVGYVSLINPMVFVMEGTRAAALGQEGYLPYWLCQLALWCFITFCWIHGTHRLKRRLDCI